MASAHTGYIIVATFGTHVEVDGMVVRLAVER